MKNKFYPIVIFFLITSGYTLNLNAQVGALDVSFDVDGKVNTPIGLDNDFGNSIALQSDGKIIVAGFSNNGTDDDFALIRYNSDGSLDVSFDTDGKVTTDIASLDNWANSVAIQSDGKIVASGYAFNGADFNFALIRYNTNGSLDATFDTDGIVITDVTGTGEVCAGVAIQSDGKIVATGSVNSGGDLDMATVRYNTDGSLDNTFDTDGIVITDFFGNTEQASCIAIQTDGKIVVAGYSDYGSFNWDFAAARYNTNGSLDVTFSGDGKVMTAVAGTQDVAHSIDIHTDGKIILAGQTNPGADYDIAVVRYTASGTEDVSFSTDGIVTSNIGNTEDNGWAVMVLSDGKILVAGTIDHPVDNDLVLLRYNTNGTLDNTFDTDGISFTDFGGDDVGYGLALQTDGKILVGGTGNTGSSNDFAVARFIGDVVGLEENNFESSLILAPNPTDGLLTVSIDHPLVHASVKLVNLTGEILINETDINGNLITLNLSLDPSGIYFLEIVEGANMARVKVVKN